MPIASLCPHPRNPRRGNLEAVKDSLRHHGQYRPVVANRRTGEVLAGNHVLRAASELGFAEIAATFVDLESLVGEERATLLWTDPPYGVGYEGRTAARLRLRKTAPTGSRSSCRAPCAAIDASSRPAPPSTSPTPRARSLSPSPAPSSPRAGHCAQTVMWVTDSLVLGHADYHFRHEPLVYGYKLDSGA
ncbi:MAG TPA: ParB/RepB/Spo0J family partition protein [Thermoleophilaceae bacterium]|nr:ParB/RepB/Spo0J family partition protein [Thermoleophilaceae bacterium]